MKRKYSNILGIICLLFMLNACISIEEFISFNRSGGGTYRVVFDAATVASELTFSIKGKSVNPAKEFLKDHSQSLDLALYKLSGLEGISNATLKSDTALFKSTVEFQFKDLAALNEALAIFYGYEQPESVVFFEGKKNSLTRLDDDYMAQLLKRYEHLSEGSPMGKFLLKDLSVTSQIRVEGKVKSVSNEGYQLADQTLSWKKHPYTKRDQNLAIGTEMKLKGMKIK